MFSNLSKKGIEYYKSQKLNEVLKLFEAALILCQQVESGLTEDKIATLYFNIGVLGTLGKGKYPRVC
jgi:hypothetical protein